jgi:hypothetical protein
MLLSSSNIHQGSAMKTKPTLLTSIDRESLVTVAGGAARVAATARSSDLDSQLQLMLTQIGDSIKEVGKTNSSSDQMMPMMMMMMMMGGGGGSAAGGAAAAAPPPPPPSVVKVNVGR